MNSILNKNLENFKIRFPKLFEQLNVHQNFYFIPKEIEIKISKSGLPTILENGILHHSIYAPEKEAQKLISTEEVEKKDTVVFYGFGLGYSVIAFAKKFPQKTIVLVEPDISRFFLALSQIDWSDVFLHKKIICLINASVQTVIAIEEQIGINNCAFFSQTAHTQHATNYFSELTELTKRNLQKKEINEKTLEKFSKLWLKNTWKNRMQIAQKPGIVDLKSTCPNMRAIVLAAGPTLDTVLPHLKELKKRAIIICVDTALKSCLHYGVEPDFILLFDPQYWNARHILGLKSPSSILITEVAAWPSVFRFQCKEIRLSSSLYPLGQYLEKFCEIKGSLSPGGSVATSAWDFAKHLGCSSIFMAGLDLGFPNKKTHSNGCQFEQTALTISNKINTIENFKTSALLDAYPYIAKNYDDDDLLTDKRLSLYAWWFESKCMTFKDLQVFTLTSQSLKIPGIIKFDLKEFFNFPEQKLYIKKSLINENELKNKLEQGISNLQTSLNDLYKKTQMAINLCSNALKNIINEDEAFFKLQQFDKSFLSSNIKEVVSLVFPTESQLEREFEKHNFSGVQSKQNFQKSKIIYTLLKESIENFFYYFSKC
ncbi:MAG: motility associated factor glycosyltransferase family protein [Treponema sp.]|nr:motility associated factor glycosyltransferase family protein [Treponema sp.]